MSSIRLASSAAMSGTPSPAPITRTLNFYPIDQAPLHPGKPSGLYLLAPARDTHGPFEQGYYDGYGWVAEPGGEPLNPVFYAELPEPLI